MPRAKPQSAIQRKPPDGIVRHSQLVGTYGPGAMMDLVDDAVLIAGIDRWHYITSQPIQEPRLRDALMQRYRHLRLSREAPFKAPPIGKSDQPDFQCGVQALLFPAWGICQNLNCRELVLLRSLETKKNGKRQHHCDDGTQWPALPARFVAACPHGHLEDFPWASFVHANNPDCKGRTLQLREGSTGDFSEIKVKCKACGETRQLSTALTKDANPICHGHRPWLGDNAVEDCDQRLRLLVRSASNGYFPKVVSALSIPEKVHALVDAVQNTWNVMQAATSQTLATFRTVPAVAQTLASFSDEDVLDCVARLKAGEGPPRQELRTSEFEQFLSQPYEKLGDTPGPKDNDFFARRLHTKQLPSGVDRVVLVHRLREVRALLGFTRLEPEAPDLQGAFLDVKTAQIGDASNWLPATEVKGEGVFLVLNEAALKAWESRPAVQTRERALRAGHARWKKTLMGSHGLEYPGIRFYMLHALSHLLMSAIAMECGYPSSSIRERLYCRGPNDDGLPMTGILLSTGAASSEGTLGGLVDQARCFESHLRRAWDLAHLCSNDPGCSEHVPDDALEDRNLEGAACHTCLYVAETSCERFNSFLDRTLVAPTLNDEDLAFFRERP